MLIKTPEAHLPVLMGWFDDEAACRLWGGPYFRYPYNIETFKQDIAWLQKPAYSLVDDDGYLLGFGQLYIRYDRIHLARLVVAPNKRGQGLGKMLVQYLTEEAARGFTNMGFSLFVYKHNRPAINCYQRMGFAIESFPSGEPFKESCFYMVKDAVG